jgi:hypothetical protein
MTPGVQGGINLPSLYLTKQGEVVSRGKWDLIGKLVSWIRKDTLLSAHTVRTLNEAKIQTVLSALQGEGQTEKIRTFSHILIESARTAETDSPDSSPPSPMSETAQHVKNMIQQQSTQTPETLQTKVESYVGESIRKPAIESLRKDISRLKELENQISTLGHQLSYLTNASQVLQELRALRTEKDLLEEKLDNTPSELQAVRVQLELQTIIPAGMKTNISQMQGINDPNVTGEMPTGDYFRFLDFLTVEVDQKQADGSITHVDHSPPSTFPELEKEAKELNDLANTLENESKAEGLPHETVAKLTQEATNHRAQAADLYKRADSLQQAHAFATLNSLAETPEEKAVMEALIKNVKDAVEGGTSFNNALDKALKQKVDTLPRNLKYLLIAGAQSSMSFIMTSCNSMTPKENLFTAGKGGKLTGDEYGGRNVTVRMRKGTDGSISEISISQEMLIGVGTFDGYAQTKTPVVSAPILQETTITLQPDGQRAVKNSVRLTEEPTIVGNDDVHKLIASRLTETYSEAQTTTGSI